MTIPNEELQTSKAVAEYNGFPFVGVLPELLQRKPLEFMRDLMQEHGDFVKVMAGPQPLYVVSNPDYLQRILRDNHHNYRKPDLLYKAAAKVIGNGLVLSEGDFWLRQRRMMQPYFHRKYLTLLTETMTRSISEVLETWETLAQQGNVVDMGREMSRITMAIITNTMFGTNTLSADDMLTISRDMPFLIDHATLRGYMPFIPDWLPLPGNQQFESKLQNIFAIVTRFIDLKRQEKGESADLISMLLAAVDEETNEQMTNKQLFDEAMTIFLAGFETTSTVLTWLWHVLNENPEVESKLRAEIETVLGKETPNIESLQRLTYSRMVFQETMRMYPPVPLLPRVAVEADRLGDYEIPANALLVLFFYGAHHHPSSWENPDTFIPERFTPEESKKRSQFAYLPFSAGPRKCIGDEFALMEGVLAMTMMLQHYKVSLLADHKVEPKLAITLRPANGILANLQKL
jgi:cytochrome P450